MKTLKRLKSAMLHGLTLYLASSVASLPLLAQSFSACGSNICASSGASVGIGTTTPDSALQVPGILHVSPGLVSVYIGSNGDQTDTGGSNAFVGYQAGQVNTSGYDNSGFGLGALYLNTTGTWNTALGRTALRNNVGGNRNTATGMEAIGSNTSGSDNTASGAYALANNTDGSQSTAVGQGALLQVNGSNNTAVGMNAGQGYVSSGWSINSGSFNAFLGSFAGYMATGNDNVLLGGEAGRNNTGSGNVFLGRAAGYLETGSNKLYIANSATTTPLIYGDFSAARVGIGTTTPTHELTVIGTVSAKEVVVTASGADYVFDSGYALEPLEKVAAYVAENHHLPDIPSAREMKDAGLSVGEMQIKLLAKIEELTLHMIQADERIKELEKQNRVLRQK